MSLIFVWRIGGKIKPLSHARLMRLWNREEPIPEEARDDGFVYVAEAVAANGDLLRLLAMRKPIDAAGFVDVVRAMRTVADATIGGVYPPGREPTRESHFLASCSRSQREWRQTDEERAETLRIMLAVAQKRARRRS